MWLSLTLAPGKNGTCRFRSSVRGRQRQLKVWQRSFWLLFTYSNRTPLLPNIRDDGRTCTTRDFFFFLSLYTCSFFNANLRRVISRMCSQGVRKMLVIKNRLKPVLFTGANYLNTYLRILFVRGSFMRNPHPSGRIAAGAFFAIGILFIYLFTRETENP